LDNKVFFDMISCSNPFSVLSNKKVRQDGPKKDTKPGQRKEPKKSDVKKDESVPKKDVKAVVLPDTLKVEESKVIQKEQEKQDKDAKRDRALTDKHDRSGKGHQVRKDGKGVGGWDDAKVDSEIAQDILAEEKVEVKKEAVQPPEDEPEAKADKKKPTGKSPEELAAEAKAREEEAKLRELEEKQMTLDEWKAKQKENAPPPPKQNLRTVDQSGFKGMVPASKSKGEQKLQVSTADKKKVEKKEEKKDDKKVEKKDDRKEKVQVDVGFRIENSSRQGKGKGEGKGEGGKGKGGKGRGNTHKDEAAAPQVDDEKAFPALGGAPKAPDAPVQPSA